ncbi:MAG: glycosyltransferase family 29 protein [Pseudomonadota bacterium]
MFDTFTTPFLRRNGDPKTLFRHILTAGDSAFFDSLLLLIESIYTHSYQEFYSITIYDLGLTQEQRKTLEEIPRVKLLTFPTRDINDDYIKNYFFKVDMMYLAQYHAPTNFDRTLFLYIDAGILLNRSLGPIWKQINETGHFITDMADRAAWESTGDNIRLFNTFPDELLESGLDLDFDLLSKSLLRPGILGFKLHAPFFVDVIEKCYTLVQRAPELLRGPKFTNRQLDERADFFQKLKSYQDENDIFACTDEFIGFRHDQFLYTYLIHKAGYDYSSAKGVTCDITHAFASRKNLEGGDNRMVTRGDLAGKYNETFLIHRNTVTDSVDVEKLKHWFAFDNEEIADRLRGKRIAIVGPAQHVYESDNGALIDQHDFVCRVNKYRKDNKFAKNIGSRCDLLIHCISETEETGGPVSAVDFSTDDPVVLSPYALLDNFDEPSTFQPYYGNLRNFRNYFRKYDYKTFAPSNEDYLRLERELGSRPNTGFTGILTLLDLKPAELFVTGFTFFAGGYHSSYRNETETDVLTKMSDSGFHDQAAQLDYFVRKVANNPRLRMDMALHEIVNKARFDIAKDDKALTIIGNGPSLKGFNFRTLRNQTTVSFNRAYIIYKKENFYPCHYFCIDKAVLLNCLADIEGLLDSPIQRFVLLDCPETAHLKEHPKVELVGKTKENAPFFGDVATYSLHHLINEGYRAFDIYGCDCSYIEDIDKLNVDVERNEDDPARRIVLKPRKGASDPNHFLPEYFGEGTEYSVPREANHYKCWEGVKALSDETKSAIVFRTPSKVSHLFSEEKYLDNADQPYFISFLKENALEITRAYRAHVDETKIVAKLLSDRKGPQHTIIDVGAHYGIAASFFYNLGWTLFCFEPDAENRKKLIARYKDSPNVTIDTRAVSDQSGEGAAFFTSDESTGISGLHAFRDTHAETAKVDVTTVRDIIAEHNINHVDFLKIDVEGFDFSVLKGVPWAELKPDVIECEFEDAKTLGLGHTWRDVADYLCDRGYAVYVSEWHPILRYGIRHDWRRVERYPGVEMQPDAWGNLLAFRDDPGYGAVREAFESLLKKRDKPDPDAGSLPKSAKQNEAVKAPSAKKTSDTKTTKKSADRTSVEAQKTAPVKRPFYAPFGEWLRRRSPRIFSLVRFARRAVAGFLRRGVWTLPLLFGIAAIAVMGALQNDAMTRLSILGVGAFAAAMVSILYLGLRLYQYVNALSGEIAQLRKLLKSETEKNRTKTNDALATNRRLAENALKTSDRLKNDFGATVAKQNNDIQSLNRTRISAQKDLERKIATGLDRQASALTTATARLTNHEADLSKQKQALNAQNKIRISAQKTLEKEINRLQSTLDDDKAAFAQSQKEIQALAAQSVSLDMLAVMRAMRPLWLGGSSVERLNSENNKEHGHGLLMALLIDEEKKQPGLLASKTLIEIGTTREHMLGQKSTQKLAIFTMAMEMNFVSVDMDEKNTAAVKKMMPYINPAADAKTKQGEQFLQAYDKPLDYVYLDAFDIHHDHHTDERHRTYQKVLNTEITDDACWEMHRQCAEAIIEKMIVGGIVALDDTWTGTDGQYEGKGKLAAPLLLENGFEIAASTQETLCLKRVASAAQTK